MRVHNKYFAKKTVVDGIRFDSRAEANRYCELKILLRAGVIKELRMQVPYVLIEKSKYGRKIVYKADFVYNEKGETIVEDVKSKPTMTGVYKLKKRMLAEKYGIEIKEVM